jgi:NAD(P)-dependent dehydrogenase (short-subunit alcohol dehydrogenase family)
MSTPSLNCSKGVAIITGCASQGIGRAIAVRLASDGFDIVINDLPSQLAALEQIEKDMIMNNTDQKVLVMPGDVSDEATVVGIVDKTVEVFGRLDVMVANAGVSLVKPLFQSTSSPPVHPASLWYGLTDVTFT